MLKIDIPAREMWDERSEGFVYFTGQSLSLEHSLVSLSKWEARHKKPFLSRENKTDEEITDYIRCMTLTQNVEPTAYSCLTNENIAAIQRYIDDPMTATTFGGDQKGGSRRVITSEVIYYWLVAFNIPFECQKWHLNRLLTLIKVCEEENKPRRKIGRNAAFARNKKLNTARRAAMRSKG